MGIFSMGDSAAGRLEVRHVRCGLCGADDARPLIRLRDRTHGVPGWFQVVRCRRCGLAYLDPMPTGGSHHQAYPEGYLCHGSPGKRAMQPLLAAELERCFAGRLAAIERHAGRLHASARLLDIGCGDGLQLAALHRLRGCRLSGLDISAAAVAFARESCPAAEVLHGELEGSGYSAGAFDVVTLFHVLEHAVDPLPLLRQVQQALRPGGVAVVETPNLDSLERRILGRWWNQWDAPRHLHHFAPGSLARMAREAGLEVLEADFPRTHDLAFSLLEMAGLRRDNDPNRRLRLVAGLSLATGPLERLLGRLGQGGFVRLITRRPAGNEFGSRPVGAA